MHLACSACETNSIMSQHTQMGESIEEEETGFTAGPLGHWIPGVVYNYLFCQLDRTSMLILCKRDPKNKRKKKNVTLFCRCRLQPVAPHIWAASCQVGLRVLLIP